MNARKLVMISDPLVGMTDGRSNGPVDLRTVEEEMRSFDLCGRSWADPPKDMAEFLFNTFKPIFCSGRKGDISLNRLADSVHWLAFDGTTFAPVLPNLRSGTGGGIIGRHPSLLVICSEKACKSLLGKSMVQLFAQHIERDDSVGEKAGLFLREIELPSCSLLATRSGNDLRDVEVVLVPWAVADELVVMRSKVNGISRERAEDMRVDYVRRVHRELGCDKHSIW
jgi:hypothetical protein